MSENRFVGRPVEDVVAAVDDRDPAEVREALDPITVDGFVTTTAIETAVSDTSMVAATAETRTELAGIAYAEAAEAAAPVDDIDIVAARLDEYAERLDAVETRVAGLTDDLPTPVEQLTDPEAVYELAVQLRDVAARAQGITRTADDLSLDVEAFESWLDNADRRYDEFAEDVALVDESLTDLAAVVDAIPAGSEDPAADWADATMRARVLDLLVADLRHELENLRAWADRENEPFRRVLEEDVAAVEERVEELDETLAARATPAWHERFEEQLTALDRELEQFETPVDWEQVQEALDERRADAFEEE
jgi:hypothetical protein